MKAKAVLISSIVLAAVLLSLPAAAQAPYAATPGEPACPGNGGLVKANVVALDQPMLFNRLGAKLPNGMMFALAVDVFPDSTPASAEDDRNSCRYQDCQAGQVRLRTSKRPRPLVLRVNQEQCLEVTFTNLLNPTPETDPIAGSQPTTRAAGVHVQGLEWVKDAADDGSWVGNNTPSSLVAPGGRHVYTLFAAHEGSFLLYSTGDTYGGNAGIDGGTLAFGLFGALHVEPQGAEWYRSQLTAEEMKMASQGATGGGQPIVRYRAVYPLGNPRAGRPILNMLNCPQQDPQGCPFGGELVHSDLTAVITGREADGRPGRFPQGSLKAPVFNPAYALPDRLQPYREFTIVYHEMFQAVQAFNSMYATSLNVDGNGADNFGFNYGMGGIASEILANRLGVGPMGNCPSCKYEEFFLTSWAVGDPAIVVDIPATQACKPTGRCIAGGATCDPDAVAPAGCGACNTTGFTCDSNVKATRSLYPDDPSNVYHSYMADHTKFRILHGGVDLHHLHHQHAHQWLHSPNSPNGDYTDSQSFGPGSSFTLEMVYNGSGNVNQTVGDSIFHCHFYPHFAGGMWSLWRVHDVFEAGTEMEGLFPKPGSRALPDGEIAAGTPIPALVPMPTLPMAPMPAPVRLTAGGKEAQVCDDSGANCISPFTSAGQVNLAKYRNPGYPFFIPGIGGQRAPHPPMDFAREDPNNPLSPALDGGLPRHLIRACPAGLTCAETPPLNAVDFSKTLTTVSAFQLPEEGTAVEKIAMAAHARRLHPSFTPEAKPAQFTLNGLPPEPGAPYADPCINYSPQGGKPQGLITRRYKAANIQLDAVFNKEGWHFPQQRMLALWGDVVDTLAGRRAPEPLFFRANSGECVEYTHANLVPNVYELDDFQVRTPTDILGQHIHLVKFDVTSSDGATNGFNYEDGTFSPDEVNERIRAIRAFNGCKSTDPRNGAFPCPVAKSILFFGNGPGGRWVGAQATIQRWYADPLFDGPTHDPAAPGAQDRTLRTVFTHDHFGPSTHQQAGLYAGLVIEPKGSLWFANESPGVPPFGGYDAANGGVLPGRTVTGPNGLSVQDGGPTTWQAVIETPDRGDSFREFVFAVQDSTLTYEAFPKTAVNPFAGQGFCSGSGTACKPAAIGQPASGCPSGEVCYGLGFCSNNPTKPCRPGTWLTPEDISPCGYGQATCNLVAGVPGQVVAASPLNNFAPAGQQPPVVSTNVATWGTLPIDPPYKIAAEVITLAGGTNSFSTNYRNEPLFPRLIDPATQKPAAGQAGDVAYAYASIPRPGVSGTGPYPPLTRDAGPNDPFTPLLRAYAGDDVQVRTLMTGQINPHNFTIHGLKWLTEPSMVDSGWRNSQVMGISEHFEQVLRVPTWVGDGYLRADYLYMPGAAAIEQAGGNWGLLRAYGQMRPDLRPLPQNPSPGKLAGIPVCPQTLGPPYQRRSYTVVATTAQQALGGPLVLNSRSPQITSPAAILYFKLQDLSCPGGTPSQACKAKDPANPEPLVLRANAGDCIDVTLWNVIDTKVTQGTAGAAAPNLPAVAQTSPPTFGLGCGTGGSAPACLPSNVSNEVGLHPQLVSFDSSRGSAFNAGTNPPQTVAIGAPPRTYTWYAGNVDTSGPTPRYIPIEFGATNLLPADVFNHYQLGLFGALVVEPVGASGWTPEDGTTALVRLGDKTSFREHVLFTQDGLANPPSTLALGNNNLNAVNYKTEPLFVPAAGTPVRTCSTAGDFSCVLSSLAALCGSASCGDPQTPILNACAGEQVRLRLLHPGGINTNQVFELYGHVWAETPYMSVGVEGCTPPTTHTNLYASSVISTDHRCRPQDLTGTGLLAQFGAAEDSLTDWQGSRMGHGPSNHFDILIPRAGGANAVPGDYLYRTYPAMHFKLGLWGLLRVEQCAAGGNVGP